MISDIVCEQLIKKKTEGKDVLKMVLFGILGVGVPPLLFIILTYFFGSGVFALIPLFVVLFIGGIALAVHLIKNCSFEYEYIYVNGELSIDKIVAREKRSRLISFDAKNVEGFGKYVPGKTAKNQSCNGIYIYTDNYSGKDAVYFDVRHASLGMVRVVFSPNLKMALSMRPYLNRSMFNETFPEAAEAAKKLGVKKTETTEE